jgi:hypothetical protein
MSDKLADVLIAAAGGITAAFAGGKPAAAAAGKPAANKTPPAAGPKAGANGAAAGKPAATQTKPPQKAPAGKYTADQVKAKMREVLNTPGLGRPIVVNVLDENANGAKGWGDVKPEYYDALYEAFDNELKGGAAGEAAGADADLGDLA